MPGMTKAIIDFSGYTGDALLPAAQTTHDELNTNVATFPEPPPTLADLTTLIQNYGEALAKKASRARADFIAFGDNGAYVNIVAKGDPMIVSKSGYPSYEPKFSPDYSAPGAPANVVLRQGTVSSSMVCRFQPERRRMPNEAWTCTSDPNVEANWKGAGIFNRGKATLMNFDPGTTVWVRFRTIGLNGIEGAWSDPAKLMVV